MSDDLNINPTGHEPERVPPHHAKPNGAMPEDTIVTPIAKPVVASNLDRFKSTRGNKGGQVATLQTALPHHRISDAKDYVRLHPDEDDYWSDPETPYCFVNVPNKGQKGDTLYLIIENLVPEIKRGKLQRLRLALATKPGDIFFLCHIPFDNLDNIWNATSLNCCQAAKSQWVEAISLKSQGKEGYALSPAQSKDGGFADPKWPKQSLEEIIEVSFGADRMIDSEDHPGFVRFVGGAQKIA
jgi:hypothetical protein